MPPTPGELVFVDGNQAAIVLGDHFDDQGVADGLVVGLFPQTRFVETGHYGNAAGPASEHPPSYVPPGSVPTPAGPQAAPVGPQVTEGQAQTAQTSTSVIDTGAVTWGGPTDEPTDDPGSAATSLDDASADDVDRFRRWVSGEEAAAGADLDRFTRWLRRLNDLEGGDQRSSAVRTSADTLGGGAQAGQPGSASSHREG